MKIHRSSFLGVVLLLVLAVSCSGTGSPISPENQATADENPVVLTGQTEQDPSAPGSQTQLWGFFELVFNFEEQTVEVIPCRSAEFSLNVVKFLNADPLGVEVNFNGTTPGSGYIDVDLNVIIHHPLDDTAYNGYDVRGIFIGNGSGTMAYNSDLVYPVSGTDQMLLNADGYTRWFNPTEFPVPKIFGYIPGNLASPGYTGTATLCPYKYFGEGLGPVDPIWDYLESGSSEAGYFKAGTGNSRNYIIRFPIPIPGVKYGYAVVANWAGTAPQFHPSHADEALAVGIENNSTLYYVDDTNNGGILALDISVFDWDAELTSGIMEDYSIFIESTVLSAVYELDTDDMTPTLNGTHWFSYHVNIPADNIVGIDGNEMWVIVEDSTADYTNPLGVPNTADIDKLAACFRYPLTVSDVEPIGVQLTSPNGGETWHVSDLQDISWTASPSIVNVKIELSLDSGANYTQVISASTPNNGIFTWYPIPPEAESNQCRIMISDVDNPDVFDDSDADFSIELPTIEITSPNGGEIWKVGDSETITWIADPAIDAVEIRLSLNSGAFYGILIVSFTPNDGEFIWDTIPESYVGTTCRIEVADTDFPLQIFDDSDADFEIYEPWMHLSTPNGGEVWPVGSSQEITWECSETGGTVSLAYSNDGFLGDDNVIVSETENDGSYMWGSIPSDPSYYAMVRVRLDSNPMIQDYSDGYFYIEPQPSITVLTPNGGEELKVGHSFEITWTSVNVPDPVHISYSTDGFQSDTHWIAVYTYNDGSFLWDPIPFDLSDTMRIKVESSVDSDIYDISDADCQIADSGWARTWGSGSGGDGGNGTAIDEFGNSYVTGFFAGTVDFDPGSGVDSHPSNGNDDIFLSKFDSSGNFQWAQTWGGPDSDYGAGIVVNKNGMVYMTGAFSGTVDFDPGSGVDSHTSNGYSDAFLSVFSPSGVFLAAFTWGGSDPDAGNSVAGDQSFKVFVVGHFTGTVDFNPGIGVENHTSNGTNDIFLSKFDSSGNLNWADTWGGSGFDYGNSVALDAYGSAYITGEYQSTVDFDPGIAVDNRTSNGGYDVFLSKIDSTGSYVGADTWGGSDFDNGINVAVDVWGNVYVSGYFNGTADFDPGGGDTHISNGYEDAFLSKFDSNILFKWARTWGDSQNDFANSIAVDILSNVYVLGEFYGTVDFDPAGGVDNHISNGGHDVFLSQFDSSGYYNWARTWGGPYDDYSGGVGADGSGNAYATGSFMDTADFDPGSGVDNHTSNGFHDVFLSKFLPDGYW